MNSRKIPPTLREVADKDVATAKKARESWHVLSIMAEFIEAIEYLSEIRPAVSLYGSARLKSDTPEYQLTYQISKLLSDTGFAVISGGGPGIMEASNKGAYDGASAAVGLNIQLPMEQKGNSYQNVSLTFRHFFARKYAFVRSADAFVVMPGGFGTLDELSEVLTLIQTKKARHIPIIMVGREFWAGLFDWFRKTLLTKGVIGQNDLDLMVIVDTADEVVDAIIQFYEGRELSPVPKDFDQMNSL